MWFFSAFVGGRTTKGRMREVMVGFGMGSFMAVSANNRNLV